jgi:molecular chaperone GrpE
MKADEKDTQSPEGGIPQSTENPEIKEDIDHKKQQQISVTISNLELEELKHEAKEYKDKYLRVLAESENARKRLLKEKQETIQFSLQNLISEFLIPIDQLEQALKHAEASSSEVKQWCLGFEMILAHFKEVLSNNDVYSFVSVGNAFDPHLHEAVEIVETNEHPDGIVVAESIKGYKMGERVIRPARVKVSKSISNNEQEESNR